MGELHFDGVGFPGFQRNSLDDDGFALACAADKEFAVEVKVKLVLAKGVAQEAVFSAGLGGEIPAPPARKIVVSASGPMVAPEPGKVEMFVNLFEGRLSA